MPSLIPTYYQCHPFTIYIYIYKFYNSLQFIFGMRINNTFLGFCFVVASGSHCTLTNSRCREVFDVIYIRSSLLEDADFLSVWLCKIMSTCVKVATSFSFPSFQELTNTTHFSIKNPSKLLVPASYSNTYAI